MWKFFSFTTAFWTAWLEKSSMFWPALVCSNFTILSSSMLSLQLTMIIFIPLQSLAFLLRLAVGALLVHSASLFYYRPGQILSGSHFMPLALFPVLRKGENAIALQKVVQSIYKKPVLLNAFWFLKNHHCDTTNLLCILQVTSFLWW